MTRRRPSSRLLGHVLCRLQEVEPVEKAQDVKDKEEVVAEPAPAESGEVPANPLLRFTTKDLRLPLTLQHIKNRAYIYIRIYYSF